MQLAPKLQSERLQPQVKWDAQNMQRRWTGNYVLLSSIVTSRYGGHCPSRPLLNHLATRCRVSSQKHRNAIGLSIVAT